MAELLEANGPVVVAVYGIAGVGKSTLLQHFANHTRTRQATAIELDCRLVEPTDRGFLAELAHLTQNEIRHIEDAVQVLAGLPQPVVLSLDHFECFLLLDTWLRNRFLPAMPEGVRLITASRQPPVPLWSTTPHWHGLFKALALEPLSHEAALELLEQSGIDNDDSRRLAAVTRGNPLALKLAASAAVAHRSVRLEDAAIQEVMQELTALNLAEVHEAATRRAVESASVARRITRSLLRALAAEDQWHKLRELSFVHSWRDGLRIHDAVREALACSLRASDPERYLESRRAAWRQLREEMRSATRSELWRYTADMLYLIENPVVREAFFPSGDQELAVEPAREQDGPGIESIIRAHESPQAAEILHQWWRLQPSAFHVVRNRQMTVVAFYCMCEARDLDPALRTIDPVAAAWCRHLEAHSVPSSSRALLLRRWLVLQSGEAPSPEQAASWLDIKRSYMELRPQLRRVYLSICDLPSYAPVAAKLGFEHLADSAVVLDQRSHESAVLDFGPGSVDGWITQLVGDELGVATHSLLDRDQRALRLDDAQVRLTPLEFKLMEYLESRDGATTSRDQILEQVWGSLETSGSSNVVDAVVKSLRRKLGDRSDQLETVRGFGYRWRTD